MNRKPEIMIAIAVFASFITGALVERSTHKPESVRVDARPGVEFEIKPAQGFEPRTIVCRLDDGKVNITGAPNG